MKKTTIYSRRYCGIFLGLSVILAACVANETTSTSQPQAHQTYHVANYPNGYPTNYHTEPTSTTAKAMLDAVNRLRQRGAVCGQKAMPPTTRLKWNATLAQVARIHADDLMANNLFSHIGSDGRSVEHRAIDNGYQWRFIGENIADGQANLQRVMAGWQDSPGHCKNLMNGNYTEMGMVRVDNFWVQVFGKPQ